jgi:hypothetical protein
MQTCQRVSLIHPLTNEESFMPEPALPLALPVAPEFQANLGQPHRRSLGQVPLELL